MKRIIICDDEPHIVEGLRYLLRGPDRDIIVARNGLQAVEQAQEEVPDLLIIDVMMPVMSGPEAINVLRKDTATKDIPIVILTARGEARDSLIAQQAWDATVMAKPFEPQKLRELVIALLETKPSALHNST